MRPFWARARVAWEALWRRNRFDAEMHEEMRFHIEAEAERLIRERGLEPEEARRQAHVAFGGLEQYKTEGRDARGMQWLDVITMDGRLGARMLVKHRGLTLVGGFAMAVAIAISATAFEIIGQLVGPARPLEEADRLVAVQVVTVDSTNPERRVLYDFVDWRGAVVSIEQLSAFRTVEHNLVSASAPPEPIRVAEITASGFAVARTRPLAGRYLLPSDEQEGAEPVVVIGHEAWQTRYAADPNVIGRTINLGGISHTVVGVMPERFGFPVDHQFWIPLRANPLKYSRLQGPQIFVFGRLAPGVTLDEAQAELTAVGQRAAADYPDTHERLRAIVFPYTHEHLDLGDPDNAWVLRIAQLLIGALAFVVAVNLAILLYARTVTRLGEIAVRTALGASRRRILAQLFVEALVLSTAGAVAGLMLTGGALGRVRTLITASGGRPPFWADFHLSPATVVYAFGLALLAAAIMGVLPGLKATGRSLTATLHELNGRAGARLGPMWTTLVVAQIAVAVAVLPIVVYLVGQVVRIEAGPGFDANTFVVSEVALSDEPSSSDSSRMRTSQLELMSQLQAEPRVAAVTFSSAVPGFGGGRLMELEDGAAPYPGDLQVVNTLDVGIDMFDVYDTRILAGRAFSAADLGAANAVIVNRSFVRYSLGNRSALGVRLRYTRTPERGWYQIVGVVRDFPAFSPAPGSDGQPTVYHPAAPGDIDSPVLSVRFTGSIPDDVVQRFRRIGAEVNPSLQLRDVVPLSSFYNDLRSFWRNLAWAIGLMTASVLLLSAAGIYALMSFTVAQRTREIGIRTALGAAPHRLLLSIFGRVSRQLAFGVFAGALVWAVLFMIVGVSLALSATLLLTVAGIMVVVGLLAAAGPARRGLRIQASEALRAEA